MVQPFYSGQYTLGVIWTRVYQTLATLIRRTASCWRVVVLSALGLGSSTAWAVGLPIKTCSNGKTAYICKGDILVADANAGPNNLGRIVLVDPVSGSQTIVAEGNPFLSETTGVDTPPAGLRLSLDKTTVHEGQQATLTGTFTDPDAGQTHTATIDWGAGSANTRVNLSATTISEGDKTTLSGTFTDPDVADTHKITINWGDGGSTAISLVAGAFNFSATHQYVDNPAGIPVGGTFPINVTVTDSLGGKATGAGSRTFPVTVD